MVHHMPVRVMGMARAAHAGPTLAVAGLSTLIAAAAGAPVGWTLGAVLAGQLQVGWLNDLLDRERDRVLGRREKPLVAKSVSPSALRWGISAATIGVIPLSLIAFGLAGGMLHLLAVISAQAYNLVLKSTALSWLPYALSFALLPTAILFGAGTDDPWRLAAAGGLLGIAAHLGNAVPDLDGDLQTGVRGLPHRIGARASRLLALGLLIAVALMLFGDLRLIAFMTLVATLIAWAAPPRLLFAGLILTAALDVLLVLDSLRP